MNLCLVIFIFLYVHSSYAVVPFLPTLNGRYTKDIENYKLTVPHKVTSSGEFVSFETSNFFDHDISKSRRKRAPESEDAIYYGMYLNNELYHAELWPNHDFVSPNLVFEVRDPNAKVKDREMRSIQDRKLCHFTGRIKNNPDSKVVLSACNGLAGYVQAGQNKYFIEPVEGHQANEEGQYLHVMYEANPKKKPADDEIKCGTADTWEESWKKRFREKFSAEKNLPPTKRGLVSVHRYLEVLVVCDKKFLERHKHTDYENYVLTVMNMVADYYHDSSSGNQMDVVVVRIMYLEKEEEEIDLVINPDADKTLASFCKWQEKVNPKDIENPNHHDIAVLLTRHDICSDNLANCGLMGLAYVASACSGNEPCAINEDAGLILGIVVAHEMGHVMGCSHDKEGESSCPAQDTDDSFYVMAPFVHMFTTKWSTCSKAFITGLFESDLGECLNDEPQTSIYKTKNMLPGTVYDAEEQCKMSYPGSTACEADEDQFCTMLLCLTSPDSCMSDDEPPADGTKCGENKWCFRKKCVAIGQRPEAINGGWGDWGSWSSCSRTCGGGVSVSERECNNPVPEHHGLYCIGERKKVKTCNMQPCAPDAKSFREVQCSAFNKKPWHDKLHTWTPHIDPHEPCVLYCLNDDHVIGRLEPRVKDGTRCKAGTKNMCIAGACTKIGCDNEINSDAVDDICGVCNGDGTQCKVIDETYKDVGARDYKKIVTIPAGSRSILFEELATSTNTLAVSDKTEKKFFLNGDHEESLDGAKMFGRAEGIYSHTEPGKEKLVIYGPLDQDIILFVVFYRPENVGYRYRYAQASLEMNYIPHYHWELLEWSDCSVKCGGGIQTAQFTCVEAKSGKVSSTYCNNNNVEKIEETTQKCNEKPCKTMWRVGEWGTCHACKYKSGVRKREVECVRENPRPGAEDILVEDSECTEKKPGTHELCNSHKKCKDKRLTSESMLPEHLMSDVWMQTNRKSINKRNLNKENLLSTIGESTLSSACKPSENRTTEKVHLAVGTVVKDRIPSDEIKVVRVPIKKSHISSNLSDSVFETMGDSVVDAIDTANATISTGNEAVKILKQLQQKEEQSTKSR